MYKIEVYFDKQGRSPFNDWLMRLNSNVRARVAARIARFEMGNLGDKKRVGDGVFEARIHFGPGLRIYFGISNKNLIILLIGGDKKSQFRDISLAKRLWADWKEND